MSWQDFNDISLSNEYNPIPHNTIAKVRMTIKPGGYKNPEIGLIDEYPTINRASGAIYLATEYIVTEGQYVKRKIWGIIGLHSSKSEEWANIGKKFIRNILDSANNISPSDTSEKATRLRKISGFKDIDGIEFTAKIEIDKDGKNIIRSAISIDNPLNIKNKTNAIKYYDIGEDDPIFSRDEESRIMSWDS